MISTKIRFQYTSSDVQFLICPNGEPVWPIQTDHELNALGEIVKLFGGYLSKEQALPGKTSHEIGEVVGLGKAAEKVGELYAHLTKRRFRFANDLSFLDNSPLPSVVMTTAPWMDEKLMHLLYSDSTIDSAPGIIWADSTEELRLQALIHAATIFLSGPLKHPWIDIFPDVKLPAPPNHSRTIRKIYDYHSSPMELRLAFGSGAGVLNICTHTDGVDAYFGKDLVICPMEDYLESGEDKKNSPRCWQTKFCHRKKVSIEQVLQSDAILPVKSLKARILIWNGCFGLLHPEGAVAPKWSLTYRMLRSATIGSIITTWQSVFTSPDITYELCQNLLQGKTLGEALVLFNQSPECSRLGLKMCLLGDPQIHLSIPGKIDFRTNMQEHLVPDEPRESFEEDVKEANFLKAYFTQLVSDYQGEIKTLCLEVLNTIYNYEQATWFSMPLEGNEGAAGPIMRGAIMKVFQNENYQHSDGGWFGFASSIISTDCLAFCYHCGRKLNRIIAQPRINGTAVRRISLCPKCGIIEDEPYHTDFYFSIKDSTIKLFGQLPERYWKGAVVIRSKLSTDNIAFEWPENEDGTPVTICQVNEDWPVGPIIIYFFLLWGGKFAVKSLNC